MMQKRTAFILSGILCLLPIVLGLALYEDLPAQLAVHWNVQGVPDRYAAKAVTVFGLPLLFFALNALVRAAVARNPQPERIPAAMRLLALGLCPLLSLLLVPVTLFIGMGKNIPIVPLVAVLLGLIFCVSGNYLPKSRRNSLSGIKLPWTLRSDENWNKTHRLAGYLWVLGGIAIICGAFLLSANVLHIAVFTGCTLFTLLGIPCGYSFALSQKEKK